MDDALTTRDYNVTDEGIDVVERPAVDIVKDELLEESRLVDAIVTKWNQLITAIDNQTIRFSLVVHNLLNEFPDEKKKRIILKVCKHRDLKTTISKDRIYQGLRLIERRPDLIQYVPGETKLDEDDGPYLKGDGSIFYEFYFELEKYSIGNDAKVRLEKEGKEKDWTVMQLRDAIYKERDIVSGDAKNQRKRELIKAINGCIRKMNNDQLGVVYSVVGDIIKKEKQNEDDN